MTGATDPAVTIGDITRFRVVPVIVLSDSKVAVPLGAALAEAGLQVAEITLRTKSGLDSIHAMAENKDLLVGAGTITQPEQVEQAVEAGARFLVSPGVLSEIISEARRLGVPILPGVATPTDILVAISHGIHTVKFFPAETSGGVLALKALAAPFPNIQFVPTGGIGPANLSDYLAVPAVAAVGGSWMVPADALNTGDLARVTHLCRAAVASASVNDSPHGS